MLIAMQFFVHPVIAAEFNPGRIIDDNVFLDNRMSVTQIQSFLHSKKSILADIPSSQLGAGANGRSAAQIIFDATRGTRTDFALGNGFGPRNPLVIRVNPAVILTTLQKEQSLITARYQLNSSTERSALTFAMGYGCPDSAKCADRYRGFTNQVIYGSAQLARNTQLASRSYYPPGKAVVLRDLVKNTYQLEHVTLLNASTSALYQYTPHVYTGNYNMWILMNAWFPPQRPIQPYVA